VRVVIVDDHRLVRDGLRRALAEASIDVVGEAGDGLAGVEIVERLRPHVVLMDMSMPVLDGLEATRRLRTRAPESRVVMLTMHAEERLVADARMAGAVGFVVKDASTDEVVAAVQAAHAGRQVLSMPARDAAPILDPKPRATTADRVVGQDGPQLTDRERQLLQLLADGRTPKQAADALGISPKTVRNHLTKVYAKLGVESRSQAIVEALRHGIVDLG
jgi:DNA-binding NarL/FixJ family response regulator